MRLKLDAVERSFSGSVLSEVSHSLLAAHKIKLWLKRDDLIHPIVSGNKWRKLKYNLDLALNLGINTLISMGGAYSNYLHALAYIGNELGLHTIGIIRGEQPNLLNPTLRDVTDWGMELRYISRMDYRDYRNYKQCQDFPNLQPKQFWLPEGGATSLALKGVGEIIEEIDIPYDVLCIPCGTGATFAGLINHSDTSTALLGFPVLKNSAFLQAEIQRWLIRHDINWQLIPDYHFGGFAKISPALIDFMHNFTQQTAIELDNVYTGKMMYGIFDLIAKGFFQSGSRLVAIHTGGLQGNRGYH